MTAEDRNEFAKIMLVLGETYNEQVSELRAEGYWLALSEMSIDDFKRAAHHCMKTSKFFPRLVELIEALSGTLDAQEESAWLAYKDAARRIGSYQSPELPTVLAETIVAVFGSWEGACTAEFSPEMWSAKRKEFSRVFRVMLGRQTESAPATLRLIGFCERENAAKVIESSTAMERFGES